MTSSSHVDNVQTIVHFSPHSFRMSSVTKFKALPMHVCWPYSQHEISSISTENLLRHKKSLFGEPSNIQIYACDLCSYTTFHSWNLKQHTLVHTGERPHKCSICSQGFTQKHALKRHLLIHTGQKPFKCDLCPKVYRHKTTLLEHKTKHILSENQNKDGLLIDLIGPSDSHRAQNKAYP
ncbi:Zinc finger protein 628 [Araneus ventricosus]|uniref:Zinc finger protein 628 n=1 Tax=Araneus ventricosus TaxID=182803 RepID=A0A4Y2C5Z1_ARAVE|nr:Zinc finger protein 628 [Araneus ventricosus]